MSATVFGGELKYTRRYRLGQLLSGLTRHFLLMTATPHNGKEADFQLFMALLDPDRFEGRFRVRRRLFMPMTETEAFKHRDVVARAFAELYQAHHQEFPPACAEPEYEKRIKAAYPIHPEIFDRLYTDWSSLIKFQRTRGVLRLMAAVIHSLWEKGDKSPLILPANLSLDEPRVQWELTRYLSDNWPPVIEKDVDGPGSLPLQLDAGNNNLGRYQACRRVARTVYLGSAPLTKAAHLGVEDRRIKLGCVMPGETPMVFDDALRRLANTATYLYADGNRYWYSTQPTVTKLAEDRAEQLKRDVDKVIKEMEDRVEHDLKKEGDFARVHPMPASGQDVSDDPETRLVVLRTDHPYSKEAGNAAEAMARQILESRGNAPRLNRNALVFLAADRTRLADHGRGNVRPPAPPPPVPQARRFHGSVTLDASRVGRDAGRIAEEVIAHLTGLVGATVTVTLDIDAEIPSGAPENVVRTVTENSRTLKFGPGSGFERE
jgi:hypothetical protein